MTLTAPAPTLPLFATVDHEPALEAPVPFDDGEWVVEGDVRLSAEQSPDAAWPMGAASTSEDGPAGGSVAAEGAPPGTSAVGGADIGGGPEGGSTVGGAAVEGARPGPECVSVVAVAAAEAEAVAAGTASPAAREPPTLARQGPDGRADRSRTTAGSVDGRVRRERERALRARRRAELVVRTALEVLDGRRPVSHLAPFAAPEVLRYVTAGVPRRGRTAAAGASLRSLHVSLPGRAAAEVAAVCRFGTRVRALAARLELTGQGEWRCVALRVI